MVTNAEPEEEEQEPETRVEEAVRAVVAGHPQGAVRRILLYLLVILLVISPFPLLALLPVVLLGLTDSLA
jgi:hypothetical protein